MNIECRAFDDHVKPLINSSGDAFYKFRHNKDLELNYSSSYSLKVISKGNVHYQVDNNFFTLNKNECLFVNNGSHVATRIRHKVGETEGYSLFFSDQSIGNTFNKILDRKLNCSEIFEEISMPIMFAFDDRFISLLSNHTNELKHELFNEVIFRVLRSQLKIKEYLSRIDARKSITKRDILSKIVRGRYYIHSNFHKFLNLDLITEEIGISKFHFIRNFQSVFGLTPMEFVIQLRIKKAEELMRLETYSLTEIAEKCGFSNVHYFSNTFKKIKGMSPSSYCISI